MGATNLTHAPCFSRGILFQTSHPFAEKYGFNRKKSQNISSKKKDNLANTLNIESRGNFDSGGAANNWDCVPHLNRTVKAYGKEKRRLWVLVRRWKACYQLVNCRQEAGPVQSFYYLRRADNNVGIKRGKNNFQASRGAKWFKTTEPRKAAKAREPAALHSD